jgi:hypothetical protein
MVTSEAEGRLSEVREAVDAALLAVLTSPAAQVEAAGRAAEEHLAPALRLVDDTESTGIPAEVADVVREAGELLSTGEVEAARAPLVAARGRLARSSSRLTKTDRCTRESATPAAGNPRQPRGSAE